MGVTDGTRTHTQRSANSLKTVRYEESQPGIPPRRVISTARLAGDGSTPPTTSASESSIPSTAPSARPQPQQQHAAALDSGASQRSSQVKRDSGIAASLSTVSSYSLPNAGGVARQPDLPTILVQDEDLSSATTAALNDRSRSPAPTTHGSSNRERPRVTSKSASPPLARRTMDPSAPEAERSTTVAADDINLQDLTSDKLTFSTRGSLLFGGKRMQELIAAKGDEVDKDHANGVPSPVPTNAVQLRPEEGAPRKAVSSEWALKLDANSETPKHGLVAGRRNPSAEMLQASLQGGRVLSAEEISFSMKVRNMYDYGDERAANWDTPLEGAISRTSTPDLSGRSTATPDTFNGDLIVQKKRQSTSRKSSINADPRSSFYSKVANEVAGGIEDWENIDSRHVDRYGFIHLNRPASRLSESSSSARQLGTGMQRVATALRFEAEQPRKDRKLKRGPSSIRSSRSVPPGSSNGTIKRGPASMHSTHSTSSTSRSNPFRSRNQKALDEASDMLTLPPGLANIDEDEDASTAASSLKQRERSREQKWQKMAIPVKPRAAAGKGGGMRFDFDVNDPKLVERTWKGIPDRWRASAWHSFLSSSAGKRKSLVTDEELIGQFYKLQGISSADDIQIDVDVPRTINMHVMFRKRYRGGQRLLFRVLHAVSLYFPDTGYVQGMAALAVTLLCYYEEEVAFVMMVRLWQLRGLDQLFQSGFEGLMTCLKEFEAEWLRGGDVAVQLKELGIDSTAWGTRWYLTLFNMSVPFPAQLRIWDVFMLLGDASSANSGAFGGADLDVLHAISAALIDATREILLDSDFENAMKVLTSFVPIKDEDVLMRVAQAEYKMKKKRDGVKV